MSAMFTKLAIMAFASGLASARPQAQADTMMSEASTVISAASSTSTSISEDPSTTINTPAGTGFPVFLDPLPTDVVAANKDLAKALFSDVTQVDRFTELLSAPGSNGKELLTGPDLQDRLVFDFKRAPKGGNGGRILVANENNFPMLVGQGIAGAVAFLEPCGMNSPHTHPRATEMLTVVQGEIETGFVLENGLFPDAAKAKLGNTTLAFPFNATLNQFQSTIFPQGSIHFQFNNQCEDAIFVAALNSADPGTSQIAQNFYTLDDRIVNITLGDVNQITPSNLKEFRGNLPANLVKAADECIARCY